MSISTASLAFAFIALLLVALIVLLLLRHFLPIRSTPAYVLVPIFLALFLPVSVILLLPIDLASSLRTEDEATRGVWFPERLVLVAWRITYWLTFALTWYCLPIHHARSIALTSFLGSFSPFWASTSIPVTGPPKTASSIRSGPMVDINSLYLRLLLQAWYTSSCRMDLKAPRSRLS